MIMVTGTSHILPNKNTSGNNWDANCGCDFRWLSRLCRLPAAPTTQTAISCSFHRSSRLHGTTQSDRCPSLCPRVTLLASLDDLSY